MRKPDVSLTGVVIQGDTKIAFVADGFRMTFVRVDYTTESDNKPIMIHPDENGYIWGRTDQRKVIAIFVKDEIKLYHTATVNTWNYIIFEQSVSEIQSGIRFSAISFQNGSVRSVYPCGALHEAFDAERILEGYHTVVKDGPYHYLVYRAHNDCKTYDVVLNDETVTWTFRSVVTQGMSADKGEALTNDIATLTIDFHKEKDLGAFYDYYGYVSALFAFLTYRKDVGYEKIELLARDINSKYDFPSSIGECYVKLPDEISYREFYSPIQIKLLDECVFQKLVGCVIKADKAGHNEEKQYSPLPMDIIPRSDKEVGRMAPDTIRCICSALEVELDAAGIKCSRPEELKDIIRCTKKVINHFKKYSGELSSKTYDHLFSSLGHWGNPLSDRAIQAWEKYKWDIYPMFLYWKIDIKERDIEAFIKTRNNITHRGFRELDQRIANTGIALIGLIYCMTLIRVGLSSDIVKELMRRRLID